MHLLVVAPVEVGRDGSGLLLADPQISRRHLEVRALDAQVWVRDLGSTNGTALDGVPLIGAHRIRAGEVVGLGSCTIELFDWTEREPGASTDA